MKCTNCGFEIANETEICPNCSAPISNADAAEQNEMQAPAQQQKNMDQEKEKCRVCGSMLESDENFCIKCGAQKESSKTPQADSSQLEQALNAKENELNFLRSRLNELNQYISHMQKKGGVLKTLSLIFNGIFIFIIIVGFISGFGMAQALVKNQKSLYTANSKLSAANDTLSNYVADLPVVATYIKMSNNDADGNTINDNQEIYNYSDIRYMNVSFYLSKLKTDYPFGEKQVYVKFIDPAGKVMTYGSGAISPSGYTNSVKIDEYSMSVAGIGSDDGGVFRRGTYFVGIYFDGRLIGSTHFLVE